MHDLSDVVAKAKKVGMSYGQYMAAKGEFLRKLSES